MMSESPHVWEKVEITLEAVKTYANFYTDVLVWVDLEGPGFAKRVYGFWDGDNIFRVRFVATVPGVWSWRSGSNQDDAGLNGASGQFNAVEWTEGDKAENLCRRGFVRPTANGHAIQYADGTEELYDHANDPNEWYNVAGRQENQLVIDRLKKYVPKNNAEQVNNLLN